MNVSEIKKAVQEYADALYVLRSEGGDDAVPKAKLETINNALDNMEKQVVKRPFYSNVYSQKLRFNT